MIAEEKTKTKIKEEHSIHTIRLINYLTKDESAELKQFIYMLYGNIAEYVFGNKQDEDTKESLLDDIELNKEVYRKINNTIIYNWARTDRLTKSEFYREELKESPSLDRLLNSSVDTKKAMQEISGIVGNSNDIISLELLLQLMEGYDYSLSNRIYFEEDFESEFEFEEEYEFEEDFDDEYEEDGIEEDGIREDRIEKAIEPEKDIVKNIEIDEGLQAEIVGYSTRVMNVYQELFEIGFQLNIPYGVLTKEGALVLSSNNEVRNINNSSLSKLYEMFNSITDNYLVQSQIKEGNTIDKLNNLEIRRGTTYYPEFQLGNLYGIIGGDKVDTWEELVGKLKDRVENNIRKNIVEGREISQLVDNLTTCIVISEFDPTVCIKLRASIGNRKLDLKAFEEEYNKRRNEFFAGIGEIFFTSLTGNGVLEATIVFNKDAYHRRPLFAYEAVASQLKRGRIPSIKQLILGQDTSGGILTANIDRQNASIILIGAGQRSGKGVLTLNMLGTILAEGHPLVYLDGKPDMAPVLWNLGRKNGKNPAVWDAFDSNGNLIGNGAPEGIQRENSDMFGLLAYLKMLQLMILTAHLRSTKNIFPGGKNKRPFFIFDEALAVQQALSGAWQGIIGPAKNKKDDSEEAEWCRTVVSWVEQLSNTLASTINSQLPKSGISTVWLFQAVQPSTWSQYETQGIYQKFTLLRQPLMSRSSIKILGRGTADSIYGLSELSKVREIAELVLSDSGRNFVITESQKVTDINTVKIFKPYLVLNTADMNSPEVGELKNNVTKEVWDYIAPNGQLPYEAGFEGFANMIGSRAIDNLELGRQMLEEVMQIVGLGETYSTVEEYIYDCSPESFKSVGTLISGLGETRGEVQGGGINGIDTSDFIFETGEDGGENASLTDEILESMYNANINDGNNEINAVSAEDKAQRSENIEDYLIRVDSRQQTPFDFSGYKGRNTVVDTNTILGEYTKLNKDNSVDAREATKGINGMYENFLMNTPRGAEIYIKRLWKSILDTIVRQGYKKANITTVALMGGNMFIGTRLVNLDGILGGYEEIKLRDIVNFNILFKKFFMIKELIIDEEMLRAAILELGNIEEMFTRGKKLHRLIIQRPDGKAIVLLRENVKAKGKELENRSKARNDFDLLCANRRSSKWISNTSSDNIWGMKLAKKSLGGAGKLFFEKEKPKVGRALLLTGAGITVGALGAITWASFRTLDKMVDLVNGFRR